ncbi:hypothetical protein [Niabella beijingensis]|uniref:hypothetical protein n=1 Tax=Niabella beijingensis TaxID=2872700 RepID=UPI001CC08C53|nr:hypothetical protein [Niabella beijingensis]MBZ4192648.1 hypothetical protein [Niabella beijingensis]
MKKSHFLVFTFLSVATLHGCKKENNSDTGPSSFSIVVENAQGQSLLAPATAGHFEASQIKRTDLINGSEVEFNQANLDNPKGFKIANENGKSFLFFTPYMGTQQAETTTYFYWNANIKDTIICHFADNGQSDKVIDVWLNKVKVFPDKNIAGYPGFGAFKIIK